MWVMLGGKYLHSIQFSHFAIYLPKLVKVGVNLTKFWQKQNCTVFLRHSVYSTMKTEDTEVLKRQSWTKQDQSPILSTNLYELLIPLCINIHNTITVFPFLQTNITSQLRPSGGTQKTHAQTSVITVVCYCIFGQQICHQLLPVFKLHIVKLISTQRTTDCLCVTAFLKGAK